MAYHNPFDPGSVNHWKRNLAEGVRRALRTCPKCARKSLGGRVFYAEERISAWRCRYCKHEVARVVGAAAITVTPEA